MNKWIILALFYLPASAQLSAEHEGDRDALRAILQTVQTAINEQTLERVAPLLTEQAQVTFLNGEVTRGFEQLQAYYDRFLGNEGAILKGYTTQAEADPAHFYGDTAIASGRSRDHFELAVGDPLVLTSLWSATLIKQQGQWRIANLHFSTDIFRNPLLDSARRWLWWMFAIGLLVGALLMYTLSLGWRRWRRSS